MTGEIVMPEYGMSRDMMSNPRGGKQSRIKGRITEVPPLALIEVSSVMAEGGEKYPSENGVPNWHKISCLENLDHAAEHLANFLAMRNEGGSPDMKEELGHFTARAMMALDQYLREGLGE